MNNRILEIVFYLMDYLHEGGEEVSALGDLSVDLKGLGYSDDEISHAYSWILDHLQAGAERLYSSFPDDTGSTRVLTPLERSHFAPEALSFLIKLSGTQVMSAERIEAVLEHVAVLGKHPVGLQQLKSIVSTVAFNEPADIESRTYGDGESDTPVNIN